MADLLIKYEEYAPDQGEVNDVVATRNRIQKDLERINGFTM